MALSLEQQKALDDLPPPESLERIVRFLSDLGTQGSTPLGETGRAAQDFAASLGGARSFSARQTSGWVAILMDRYQIKMVEIQDFALWFVRRQEIFAQAAEAVERVPDLAGRSPEPTLTRLPVLARLPAPELLPARLPAPAVRTAVGAAALALAAPAAGSAAPVGTDGLPLSFESASPAASAPPRTALRRQPVLPLPEAAAELAADEEIPTEPLPPRRRTGRVTSDTPRLRRIERVPAAPEPEDLPDPESLAEEPPPSKRPFRLTPQMVTRPAFVTNVGLAGLLTGMSLAPVQADPLIASSAMTLATSSPLNIGSSPLNIGPTGSALFGQSPALPFGAPAFTPTVTPMTAPVLSAPVPPIQLGMPFAAPLPTVLSAPPAPLLLSGSARVSSVSAAVSAPSTSLLSPAPPPASSPVGSVFSKPLPTALPSLPPLTAPPSVDLTPSAAKLPSATQAVPRFQTAPRLLGIAAASAGLVTAANLIGRPALGASPESGQSAIGQSAIGQSAIGQSAIGQMPAGADDAPDASPSVALTSMPLFTGQANRGLTGAAMPGAAARREEPTAATPEMGQITLVAPPLQVASAQAERSGVAAAMDWKTLAGGAGPLDEGSLARLKPALPSNAALLYPALPPGRLSAGAVNLPLSAPLVQSLLQKSYGQAAPGLAARAADLGRAASGGAPAAMPLPAQIVPGKRPIGAGAGVLGHADEEKGGAGALAEAGQGQAKRGGVLDFLGLPVRLAPSLGGGVELARETAVRSVGSGPVRSQQTLRPEQFAPLRNRLFPAFHSMAVEPDKAAWRQAAPAFGLRDGKPTTILAPDARVPVQTPTAPQPALGSQPSAASRPFSLRPAPLPGGFGNIGSAVSQARERSGGGFGNIGSSLSQARERSGGGGFGRIGAGVSQALGHSSGGLGNIASSLSQARERSGGSGLGNIASVLSQARERSGGDFGNIGSGVSQALGYSGGGFGNIGSAVSQARERSGGGFGNIGSSLSQARERSGGGGFGRIGAGVSQALGHSSGGLGNIASSLSQARERSGGGSLGNIGSALSQAREHSGGRGFGNIGQVASGASQAFGHTPHRHFPQRHLPLRHPSFGSARFSPSGNQALPSANLAASRTASHGFLPSQIVSPRGAAAPLRMTASRPTGSRVVNFGPTPSSAAAMPAMRFVTPRSSNQPAAEAAPPMTIQRSETTTKATPARNEGARTQARAVAPSGGAAASEVNALAGEVWSLLKRRLATEAERRGRW